MMDASSDTSGTEAFHVDADEEGDGDGHGDGEGAPGGATDGAANFYAGEDEEAFAGMMPEVAAGSRSS